MTDETRVTRNIAIDAETDAIVIAKRDELAALTGDVNYSAAIRVIVREWSKVAPLVAAFTKPGVSPDAA